MHLHSREFQTETLSTAVGGTGKLWSELICCDGWCMCPQDYLSPQHGKGRTWCQPHWVSMNMSWCWSRMIGGKENGQLYSSSIKHHASPWAIITLFFKNFYFYCYSITIVCIFSPFLHPTPANPTSLPHLYLPPWFCPCVLYCSSCKPLSPLSPPHSPLAIVTLLIKNISNFFSWSSYHCCYSVYIYIYCV